jgi:hypothetical protein
MAEPVTLRDYMEQHWKDHAAVHDQLADNIVTALAAQNKRLDGMNEFRQALNDQAGRAVTRELFDAQMDRLEDRVASIEKRMAYYAGAGAVVGAIIAIVIRTVQTGGT